MRRRAYRYSRKGNRRGGALRLLPIVLFGLYLAYYYFSNQEEVPLTGRSQLVDITREQEAALGLQTYQQVLAESKVLRSGQAVELVREIGYRLAKVIDDDPGFDWEFNVIESDQANAFSLPGGKVAVYTGILPIVQNIDGLSAVMGHEIAHAVARHGAERMAHQKLVQYGSMATSMALGSMDIGTQKMIMGALGMGAQYGVLLPFSRKHESEADFMGLIYLARACYDPTEAPKIWERMAENSKGQPQEFMSTHPSHATRIQQLNEWMPTALAEKEKHCES